MTVRHSPGANSPIGVTPTAVARVVYVNESYNQNLWIDHPFEGAAYLPR